MRVNATGETQFRAIAALQTKVISNTASELGKVLTRLLSAVQESYLVSGLLDERWETAPRRVSSKSENQQERCSQLGAA